MTWRSEVSTFQHLLAIAGPVCFLCFACFLVSFLLLLTFWVDFFEIGLIDLDEWKMKAKSSAATTNPNKKNGGCWLMMAKETQTWPRMKIAQRSVRRNVTHFFCGDRNSSKNREETANFRRLRSVGLTQSGRCRAWQKCLVYLPNFFQGWLPLNQKRKPCHRHTHKPTHARTQTHTRTHRKARGSEIEWMEVEAAMVKSQCHPPTVRTHDIATRSRATKKKKKKKKKKHTIKSSSNSNQIATTRFFFFFPLLHW